MVKLLRELGNLLIRCGHLRLPEAERQREIAIIHLKHAATNLNMAGDIHESHHVTMMVKGLETKNKRLAENREYDEEYTRCDGCKTFTPPNGPCKCP